MLAGQSNVDGAKSAPCFPLLCFSVIRNVTSEGNRIHRAGEIYTCPQNNIIPSPRVIIPPKKPNLDVSWSTVLTQSLPRERPLRYSNCADRPTRARQGASNTDFGPYHRCEVWSCDVPRFRRHVIIKWLTIFIDRSPK